MNWKKLLKALEQKESNFDPYAIGDNGLALGILQAHPSVLIDVNKNYGVNFAQEDRIDPTKSRAICVMYVLIYATEDRIGHKPTEKDFALCWHYGPNFYKIEDRHKYWESVSKIYNEA